jgi:hypothetical protein
MKNGMMGHLLSALRGDSLDWSALYEELKNGMTCHSVLADFLAGRWRLGGGPFEAKAPASESGRYNN